MYTNRKRFCIIFVATMLISFWYAFGQSAYAKSNDKTSLSLTQTTTLLAGAAKYDMTPTTPIRLGGYGSDLICDPQAGDVLDSIYLRVLVLESTTDTENRLLFIVPDMCLYDELAKDPTRIFPTGTLRRFAEAADVTEEQVIIIPTHNHQGPESFCHEDPTVAAQDEIVIQGFIDTIEQAVDNLVPVNMGVIVDRNNLGVNRRPNYGVAPDLAYDNRFIGLKFTQASDDMPVACVINYACHQTSLGNDQPANANKLTTEIIGWGINTIEETYQDENSDFVALFFNGFYGDAGPNINGEKNTNYNMMKSRGEQFGLEVLGSLDAITPMPVTQPTRYYMTQETVDTPNGHYESHDIICRAACIGDEIGFVGVSCEAFNEIGSSIKAQSPFPITMTSANVSGDCSYAGSFDAYHDGVQGHEVSERTDFGDDIEEVIVRNSLAALRQLKNDSLNKYAVVAATAKDFNPYHPPEFAFDGNTRTKWFGNGSSAEWLQADIGTSKSISKVIMNFGNFSRSECGKDFKIQVSDDPTFATYTTVVSESNNSTGILAYHFSPVTARYVRFDCTAAYGSDSRFFPAVYQMEIWGSGTAGDSTLQPSLPSIPEDAVFSDQFNGTLSQWVNTSGNAVINNKGQFSLTNDGTAIVRTTNTTWSNYIFEVDAEAASDCYMGLVFRASNDDNCYMWQISRGALGFMKKINGNWSELKPYITLPIVLQADALADIMRHFTIEVNGAVIQTYVDGILIDTTIDGTFTHGGVGFWTSDSAVFDNVAVRQTVPPEILLEDDFSSGLSNWENTGVYQATESNNQLRIQCGGYGIEKSIEGDSWNNYTYEVDAAFESVDYSMGLIFRAQDEQNYYFWNFANNAMGFYKVTNGIQSAVKTYIGLPFNLGTDSHHFRIEVNGTAILTYIDDMFIDLTIDDSFRYGGVGFWVYGVAYFDNVMVKPIMPDETPTFPSNALFTDDFSIQTSNWVSTGNVSISGGQLVIPGGIFIRTTACNLGDAQWGDYSCEVDGLVPVNGWRGLVFRVIGNDYYLWYFSNAEWKLLKFTDQQEPTVLQDITAFSTVLESNTSYHFKVEVAGGEMRMYINDEYIGTVTDDTPYTTGDVGFFTGSGIAMFDNVVVRPIDMEASAD